MRYVLISDNAVVAYPYSFAQLCRAHPQVSFPREPSVELLVSYSVYPVAETAPPVPDITQDVREVTPVFSGGQWVQAWELVQAPAETVAQRQEDAAQTAEKTAAKLDAWVVSYLAMTPAEAKQYVIDNVATLSQLRAITANLAYSNRVIIRMVLGR